jgi:integrase
MTTNTSRPTSIEQVSTTIPLRIDEELRRYDEHLRDVRGLTRGTRRNYVCIVGRLLHRHFTDGVVDLSKLQPTDLREFLASELDARRTPSNASRVTVGIRSYLRYRGACGDQIDALTAVILSPAHWRLATLPRALGAQEVERLLDSFSGVQRWPKRSYAIVRCALDLGLRAGEIARLTISDIDWRAGTVTLRGTKSRRQDILPLPVDTGQAVADYLQYERPPTSSSAVFVRCRGSLGQPVSSSAIQKVITRAFRRVGLPHTGSHTLRHTLACRLVENGSSLKEVADLLRHRSIQTTLVYAKLDTPQLLTVALPWPGSES